jgi:putative spermidine/putrescine transport system ATP-binding protein
VALRQEIRAIQRQLGITTLYVTHDQEEALSLSDRIVVMSDGRIEQVGTPFEIYNFPRTEFVAQFVGTLNAINAIVRDPVAGRLAIDHQEIQAAHGLDGAHAGETISIALRPERIRFATETTEANLLECTVENITFLGSIVRIQVRTGENSFYMDTFNNPHLTLPKIGQKIQVTFSTEAVLALKHPARVAV